jgi:hypothetical protein
VNPEEDEAGLFARAKTWKGPDADFAALTRSEGLDFATALLHERLLRAGANAEFLRTARRPGRGAKLDADLIGVVPGAFHREHRNTGADGARVIAIAREAGCEAEVIPTASFGTFSESARTIVDWLRAHRGRRIALVSLSKGGADVKHALRTPDAFASVAAWVSLSGIVQGTPLVEWLRRRPLRWWGVRALLWWRGHPGRTLDDLRHGPDAPLAAWPALPPHLNVVHVCGFPLRRHLSHPWAPRAYERLAPLGPNDGGAILLADALTLPGIVCPIWGADHYLTPSWDVLPLLKGIIAAALTPRQASESASQPSNAPASKSSA